MNQPMYSVGVTLVRILEVTVHNGEHGPTVMMENMNVPHRLQCFSVDVFKVASFTLVY